MSHDAIDKFCVRIGFDVIDDGNQTGTERIGYGVDDTAPPEARRRHKRDAL